MDKEVVKVRECPQSSRRHEGDEARRLETDQSILDLLCQTGVPDVMLCAGSAQEVFELTLLSLSPTSPCISVPQVLCPLFLPLSSPSPDSLQPLLSSPFLSL